MDAPIGPAILIGAGDHARVVLEAVTAEGLSIVGLIAPEPPGTSVLGIAVLGGDYLLPKLRREGVTTAVLGLGSNRLRHALVERLLALGFALPPVVHPRAYVSPTAVLSAGVVVLQLGTVGTQAEVGVAAIVNSGAVVEHNAAIGAAAHIAPGCALAGRVRVGARTLVGVGSSVRPGVTIGSDAVVGAGSAVVRDIPDGAVWCGTPARPLFRSQLIP